MQHACAFMPRLIDAECFEREINISPGKCLSSPRRAHV